MSVPLTRRAGAQLSVKQLPIYFGSAKEVMMRCSSGQNTKLHQCDSKRDLPVAAGGLDDIENLQHLHGTCDKQVQTQEYGSK